MRFPFVGIAHQVLQSAQFVAQIAVLVFQLVLVLDHPLIGYVNLLGVRLREQPIPFQFRDVADFVNLRRKKEVIAQNFKRCDSSALLA